MEWKIDLGILEKKKKIFLEGIFELKYLDLEIGKCKFLEPIKVKMVAAKTKRGFTVGGFVKTILEHPCTRCLKPVKLNINGVIEALYLPKDFAVFKKEERLEMLKNVIYYTGSVIDLSERIIEAIVIEVPQKVLCKPDCKGLCPYCGINLNEHPDHVCDKIVRETDIDPRFSVLMNLKKSKKEG